MKNPKQLEWTNNYIEKSAKNGLVRIHPFVPLEKKEEILQLVKEIREKYLKNIKK